MTKLLVGSGSSVSDAPAAAGRAAAAQALAGLDGGEPGLVVVYSRVGYDLPVLLAGIRSVTGETPLVGFTTGGHFHNGRFQPPDTGVVVLVLGARPYRFRVASVAGMGTGTAAAGRQLARAVVPPPGHADPGRYAAVLLFADGLAGDLQGLLSGVYQVTGAAVPVVGGAAADDYELTGTYVFHDGEVLANAAAAVWISSPHPLRVVHKHGWKPSGLPLPVTRVDGLVVHEIGGRPAVEVYGSGPASGRSGPSSGRSGTSPGRRGPHARWETASYALGLIEPDGSQLVRAGLVNERNELCTLAPLPPDCVVQVMRADPDTLLCAADRAVAEALLGADDPSVLLAFSCVGRIDSLGDRAPEEAARLHTAASPVTTFGCYTYGEFARTTSPAGYHNATITALAL